MKLNELAGKQTYAEMVGDFAKKLAEDCAPWLKESKGVLAYRGVSQHELDAGKEFLGKQRAYLLQTMKGREPRDTNIVDHHDLDDAFERSFGHRFRSHAVFCQGSQSIHHYGTRCIFLAAGPFKYVWSKKIDDLSDFFPNVYEPGSGTAFDRKHGARGPNNAKLAQDFVDESKYQADGLHEALTMYPKHEIMVACDSYYLLYAGMRAQSTMVILPSFRKYVKLDVPE